MRVTLETTLLCGDVCRQADAYDAGAKCGLCPISRSYASAGHQLPDIREVDAGEIPQPQQRLLRHERDMTSTLEEFHHGRTLLKVLRQSRLGGVLHREVLLLLEGSMRPVEYGAISIQLGLLHGPVREGILKAHRPLGGLLNRHGVSYSSRPKAFIRVKADRFVADSLGLETAGTLYGRCNALFTQDARVLADIVEILPL